MIKIVKNYKTFKHVHIFILIFCSSFCIVDHSKFAVSDDKSDWICVGDINRAVKLISFFRFLMLKLKIFVDFFFVRKCKRSAEEEVFVTTPSQFQEVIVNLLLILNHVMLRLKFYTFE